MLTETLLKLPLRKKAVAKEHAKSAVKAVTWRIIGTLDTIVISYLVTGQVKLALSIGGVETLSKILLYYLHERAWESFSVRKTNNQG